MERPRRVAPCNSCPSSDAGASAGAPRSLAFQTMSPEEPQLNQYVAMFGPAYAAGDRPSWLTGGGH